MDEAQRGQFYIWATNFNLDSDEVDIILARRGLNARLNTTEECRAAIRAVCLRGDTDA